MGAFFGFYNFHNHVAKDPRRACWSGDAVKFLPRLNAVDRRFDEFRRQWPVDRSTGVASVLEMPASGWANSSEWEDAS